MNNNKSIEIQEYLDKLQGELKSFLERIKAEKERLEKLGVSARKIQALIEELENNLKAVENSLKE